jgi:hypothetical protein
MTSNVIPLHSAGPVPVTPPLAKIHHLPTTRPRLDPESARRSPTTAPPRRPRSGHHPDCPYPGTDPAHCGICRSTRIAREDHT